MAQLLKIKDVLTRFVGRYEIYVMIVIRFLVSFICFMLINRTVGFMEALVPVPVSLCLAAACAFLPAGVSLFVGAILIVLNFYALSAELAFAALLIFVIMFFVYYRFSSGKGLYTLLTPILSVIRIPYVMPIAVGLLDEPQNVLSVICGSVTYFLVKTVRENETFFRSMAGGGSHLNHMSMIWSQLARQRDMFIYMIAFAAGAIVVYYIRRTKFRYAQAAAVITGGIAQLLIISIGMIYLGDYSRTAGAIIGCAVSIVISMAVAFLSLSVDYSRVEKVQFEDDEYYYYVRAVPKISVTAGEKQIKAISLTEEEEEEDRKGEPVLRILRRRYRAENDRRNGYRKVSGKEKADNPPEKSPAEDRKAEKKEDNDSQGNAD